MACVYILTNSAIPGLLKIGFTGGTAADRAAQVSQGTGVPTPYAVQWFLEMTTVDSAYAVEQSTHQALAHDRHNRAREFFTTPLAVAIDTIERIAYQNGAIATDLAVVARLLAEEREAAQRAQSEAAQRAQNEAAQRAQNQAAAVAERIKVFAEYKAKNARKFLDTISEEERRNNKKIFFSKTDKELIKSVFTNGYTDVLLFLEYRRTGRDFQLANDIVSDFADAVYFPAGRCQTVSEVKALLNKFLTNG